MRITVSTAAQMQRLVDVTKQILDARQRAADKKHETGGFAMSMRIVKSARRTDETEISLTLNLDSSGICQ